MKISNPSHAPGPPIKAALGRKLDLSSRQVSAALNVLVFTPYAIYLARGKQPPGWLVVASLGYLAISALDDLQYLLKGEEAITQELSAAPGLHGCSCAGIPPTTPITPFAGISRYRVNR